MIFRRCLLSAYMYAIADVAVKPKQRSPEYDKLIANLFDTYLGNRRPHGLFLLPFLRPVQPPDRLRVVGLLQPAEDTAGLPALILYGHEGELCLLQDRHRRYLLLLPPLQQNYGNAAAEYKRMKKG